MKLDKDKTEKRSFFLKVKTESKNIIHTKKAALQKCLYGQRA